MSLGYNVRITRGINKMSSGSTAVGNELDMAGFEGVLFIAVGSSLMEGSSNVSLKASGSTASGGTFVKYSDYADSTAMATNSFDYKILALDIHKPTKRYIKPVVCGASSGAMHTRSIIAVQYGSRVPGSTDLRDSTQVGAVAVVVGATS